MRFQTHTHNRIKDYEKPKGKRRVESGGYIPLKRRVEMLKRAGQIYKDHQAALYDYYGDDMPSEDQMVVDPTRSPSFDQIDADQLIDTISEKTRKQIEERKEAIRKAKEQEAKEFAEFKESKKVSQDNSNQDKLKQDKD